MKLAIHDDSGSFSSRWITYCEENNINFKKVNCYDTDIINQIKDCNGLMWHWVQDDYRATLFARQLITSLEKSNIQVFPDIDTCWHFDDKVGQKYLLETINAPFVKTYVFYSKKEALDWIKTTSFPKVFKLRGGAGSLNVKLVKTKGTARRLVRKAFGSGFLPRNRFSSVKDRFWGLRRDKNLAAVKKVIGGFGRLFIPTEFELFAPKQKGYIYFQDFIPNNDYDTRLIVIGERCFGVRRMCRKGDFRASGSGIKEYDPKLFPVDLIAQAFRVAKSLKTQCVAFDFVIDNNDPKIVEISYSFIMGSFYDDCPGYWDSNLLWHQTTVNPQYFIIEDFLKKLEISSNL